MSLEVCVQNLKLIVNTYVCNDTGMALGKSDEVEMAIIVTAMRCT